MNGIAQNLLAVGAGGFVGAILRYGISGVLQKKFPHFTPAGTLAVNVLGCLLIGVVMAVVVARAEQSRQRHDPGTIREKSPPRLQLFLVTGILGSLTTFSTFGYETVELLREQEYRPAFWNVAANVALGLPAVWLGWTVTRGFR